MNRKEKPDLQNIGNCGEYFIASVLSSYGFTTTITLGRAEHTILLQSLLMEKPLNYK